MTHHDHTLTAAHREYGRKNGSGEDASSVATHLKRISDETQRFSADARREIKANSDRVDGLTSQMRAVNDQAADLGARLNDVEQKMVRRPGSSADSADPTWGQTVADSPEFKGLAGSASQRGEARVRVKAVTSVPTSGGGLVARDQRPEVVTLPRLPMTVRELLAPGQTASNAVSYPRQTVRTNNAATVAESVRKPESNIAFEEVTAPVRTIAHYIKASRQIMDDAPALQSTVDAELRYGLDDAEERQLLLGDGTGVNLFGLVPQATAFAAPFTIAGANRADVLIQAIAQSEAAGLPATGIILNSIDWRRMLAMKDGQGRYLSNGPFGPAQARLLWNLPVAPTLALPAGQFLVGAFALAAQIFDRMEAEVLLSTENEDDFVRNLVTIRAEKRLALAVKRPAALVFGTFPAGA